MAGEVTIDSELGQLIHRKTLSEARLFGVYPRKDEAVSSFDARLAERAKEREWVYMSLDEMESARTEEMLRDDTTETGQC